ncbi:glucose-6-phosphate dehydrogenase [Alicyclobacillus fastidiosus]|uniref:Glucose-6-phosphate 1-dehydrogenase n=1 Tax=Alicyclobacillus fastidiosus TaxID=392011 RepID=A0ABY6ZKM3_9BACL|nr:glucose-6-phosphate dehydrogenase [Alicyclobacillus fastidiosus]WAH42656.1 glucose-6-phosphate dehydrogenase [Alicyclobacillus fastidiosus]GMA64532.1 glucose-6-phosphate 1-dehydrogenase [Alicyclobacillus fastidiosus]
MENQTAHRLPPHVFVLFGATGDLAHRKLFPALYQLHRKGRLSDGVSVVGTARSEFTSESFRDEVHKALNEFVKEDIDDAVWQEFSQRIHYVQGNVDRVEDFERLRDFVVDLEKKKDHGGNRMFYLSMAPRFFGETALFLKQAGLSDTKGWRRLIIEKPFGHDYASAAELNDQLATAFAEEEIYRIDHYLGKEMVQNIEVIRFANSMFEPLWDNRSIASIQITSSETVGVEDRASYYEQSGALRDMIQNHMLQMVMMTAMEPPSRLRTEAIRDEKVKVLRSLRRYSVDEVKNHVVRGQYTAGEVNGKAVPGYLDEPNVAPNSQTDTFISAKLFIDNFRWAGVPFYIRTGKRMPVKSTEIVVQFRNMPKHLYFNQEGNLGPNLLVIRINPVEGMYMQMNVKRPGTDNVVVPVAMEFSQSTDKSPEAYERLLHDAMIGDSTFFTRWDEVSLAWKFVDPIAEAFRTGAAPLHTYKAGEWGPQASDDLVKEEPGLWWPVYGDKVPSVESVMNREKGNTVEVKY